MKISDLIEANKNLNRTKPVDISTFLGPEYKIATTSAAIYRGLNGKDSSILHGSSLNKERQSKNTYNYYTWLIDSILPSWKNYPKRSRSFICSSDRNIANNFGLTYRVYPKGDPLIGICPDEDFWYSFDKNTTKVFLFSSMDGFNIGLRNFLDTPQTYKAFVNKLNTANKIWKIDKQKLASNKLTDQDLYKHGYENLFKDGAECQSLKLYNSFTDCLNDVLSPEKNGFKLAKLSQIKKFPGNKEIWFSGEAYFFSS